MSPAIILISCLATNVAGQVGTERVADPEKAIRMQAMRLIRALELPSQRVAAAPKLTKLGKKAVPGLVRALADPRPQVVCRLALVLRMLGEDARPAIPTLRRIAKDEDPKLAFAARWALGAFEPRGITLVTESGARSPFEIDGKQELTFTLPDSKNAFDAERLPNGHYLVAISNGGFVKEIDAKGKVHWRAEVNNPTAASRLPSGNTLICSLGDKQVIEVDTKGATVWTYGCKNPYCAERLANGNTLIAAYGENRVVEVTPEGEIAWRYTKLAGPLEAQRLTNGNTLIAGYTGRAVHEVSANGKIVFKITPPGPAWTARRLPNGDTLVGGARYLICYEASGKQRWRYKNAKTITSVRHY